MDISNHIMALGLALLSGILMAVQGSLNAALSKVIGLMETTFIVHLIGTVLLIVILFLLKLGRGNLYALTDAPWYAYLGGVISIFIIYLVAASIPQAGMANATTAIIVGQVLTAIIIDHLGAFGMEQASWEWNDLAGLALLAIGAYLLLK
ncbi:putative membrane protein [Propionispora sp. 2/2-37]|uniref:DMT family transporter n=1 Tax=Propionispora sp. 2/2-37 TaxID=1677858 RepID=UPI0006BB78A5|nr:DMT family transporter [Propionispora sp. 2/2-37]CUH96174.1 putative membrane protein [Propionispora sp. 2/2-37]